MQAVPERTFQGFIRETATCAAIPAPGRLPARMDQAVRKAVAVFRRSSDSPDRHGFAACSPGARVTEFRTRRQKPGNRLPKRYRAGRNRRRALRNHRCRRRRYPECSDRFPWRPPSRLNRRLRLHREGGRHPCPRPARRPCRFLRYRPRSHRRRCCNRRGRRRCALQLPINAVTASTSLRAMEPLRFRRSKAPAGRSGRAGPRGRPASCLHRPAAATRRRCLSDRGQRP